MKRINALFGTRESIPMNTLEREINKYMACTFFPPELIKHIKDIERYDVVVLSPFVKDLELWQKLSKVSIEKIMFCSDPQSDIAFHLHYAKKYGVKNMFMIYPSWIQRYKDAYATNYVPFPWWSDDYYKPIAKSYNVMYATANTPFYPIRYKMEESPKLFSEINPSIGCGAADNRLPFNEYIQKLNESSMFAFDGSIWNLCVLKYVEGMCCKSVVFAPYSLDMPYLHITEDDYVRVNEDNVFLKIKELLKDKERMKEIAEKARAIFLQHNTTAVRAKQFVEHVERILDGHS